MDEGCEEGHGGARWETAVREYRRLVVRAGLSSDERTPEARAIRSAVRGRHVELLRHGASTKRSFLTVALRLPVHIRALGGPILTCGVVYLVGVILGFDGAVRDPEAAGRLLPPSLYGEVIDRLAAGGSWWATGAEGGPVLSSSLFVHNARAALRAVSWGVLAGVGSLWIVFRNGLFTGLIAGVAHVRGMDGPLWRFLAPHGVVEIFAIWMAGGIGLAVGWTLFFGPRGDRQAALGTVIRHAGPLAVWLLPWLGVAAGLEVFFSPRSWPAWAPFTVAGLLAAAEVGLVAGAPFRRWYRRRRGEPPPP